MNRPPQSWLPTLLVGLALTAIACATVLPAYKLKIAQPTSDVSSVFLVVADEARIQQLVEWADANNAAWQARESQRNYRDYITLKSNETDLTWEMVISDRVQPGQSVIESVKSDSLGLALARISRKVKKKEGVQLAVVVKFKTGDFELLTFAAEQIPSMNGGRITFGTDELIFREAE